MAGTSRIAQQPSWASSCGSSPPGIRELSQRLQIAEGLKSGCRAVQSHFAEIPSPTSQHACFTSAVSPTEALRDRLMKPWPFPRKGAVSVAFRNGPRGCRAPCNDGVQLPAWPKRAASGRSCSQETLTERRQPGDGRNFPDGKAAFLGAPCGSSPLGIRELSRRLRIAEGLKSGCRVGTLDLGLWSQLRGRGGPGCGPLGHVKGEPHICSQC
ncbi:uncharacterized protein LOC131582448 [Poecile atricapillus]|uniref:uncharacterized protein LOC131582448 n=1 Tax=Poecile atricapillus TaxID=48891 RepID=UPI00273A198F|nr:uncharacterized protein LOC131582448 [Poecile atricapillus]